MAVASLGLVACGGPSDAPPVPVVESPRRDLAMQVLSEAQQAIASRDASALEKLGDSEGRVLLAGVARNAQALDVQDVALRLVDEDPAATAKLPKGQWAAAVSATWRFAGFDTKPAHVEITAVFDQSGDRVRLHGFGGGDRAVPLWLSASLHIVRSANALVLVDGPETAADHYAALAARALPAVGSVVGGTPRVVLEVPASAEDLDAGLGATPGEYAAIAAVTTFAGAGRGERDPVHVFVNPDVFGTLKPAGAQVVMTHELTHVVTDAVHSRAPQWLLEGYADHVALHDTRLPITETAGQIIKQVRRDGAPQALPGAAEFDTQATHLGTWYEAAWRAVEVLAHDRGESTLLELYRRTSRGEAVDAVLRDLYGYGTADLTRRWQQDLGRIAR